MGEKDDIAEVSGSVTRLIGQIDAGDAAAPVELCALVYDELRAIGRRMRRGHRDSAVETTDIVHEFFGRVLADGRLGKLKNRRYLYSTAADEMRLLLIDGWRKKRHKSVGEIGSGKPLSLGSMNLSIPPLRAVAVTSMRLKRRLHYLNSNGQGNMKSCSSGFRGPD